MKRLRVRGEEVFSRGKRGEVFRGKKCEVFRVEEKGGVRVNVKMRGDKCSGVEKEREDRC